MDEEEQKKKEAIEKAEAEAKVKAATIAAEEAGTEKEQAIVKQANEAAKLAKEAEELKTTNLEREEKLLARKEALAALGGGSNAGIESNSKEETPKEYNDRIEKELSEGKHND